LRAAGTDVVSRDSDVLALVGGKIYGGPDDKPVVNGTVLVRAGVILAVGAERDVKVPAGAQIVDCRGRVITAGFQNSHVHFTEPKWADAGRLAAANLSQQLKDMLTRYGVTTAVDTGSWLENTVALRKRIESGEVAGPRILTAGTPLYPVNGIPYYLRGPVPDELIARLPQPPTPGDAIALVKDHIAAGADIIKLFTGSWVKRSPDGVVPMRLDIVKAAAGEAHRRGRLVFTHPSNLEGLKVALDGGVDVLGHAIEDTRGWDDTFIPRMIAARMSLIPTLHLFSGDDNFKDILREVGDFSRAGGQILFGTDAGYQTEYDPAQELMLMGRAGLGFSQILASLTTAPAARLGESKMRGRIAQGYAGDLVVLEADPGVDVRNFARVGMTVRAGRVIYP
jgi:imidazolonepropionase-like amidohydrolase